MKIVAMITLAALSLSACGGSVLTGAGVTSSSGTSGSTGDEGEDSGTSGTGGTGGTSGTGGTGESAPCVPQPDDPDADFAEMTCADLDLMTVRNPVLHDAGSDGQLSAGESATITAHLDEIAGKGFYWYPWVKFSSDNPAVEVESSAQLYGIMACQSVEVSAQITVAASVPPGTVVHVEAQVASLNKDCPEAFSISIPVEIH